MAVKEEAETARPEPKEAGRVEVKGVRTVAPDTRTTLPGTPAGSIGSMARELGFVLTDTGWNPMPSSPEWLRRSILKDFSIG